MSHLPVVLFVDDEPLVLSALRRSMPPDRFTVLTAESADEALGVLATEPVDVIVSDEKMPKVRGSELLSEVHRRYPGVCRIMLTGQAHLDAAMQAINEGRIFRFLLKPIDARKLAEVIDEGLAERAEASRLLSLSQEAGGVCSFEVALSGEMEFDREAVVWSANTRAMLQVEPSEPMEGLDLLFDLLHPDDAEQARQLNESCMSGNTCASDEYRIQLPDGRIRWISQINDVTTGGAGGGTRLVAVLRDITQSRRQQEQLEYQAYHDSLTGLGNRASLLDRMEEALSRGSRVALLFIDIDDFKLINDSLGHDFGDRLLAAFAERLQQNVPPASLAVRFGGDEFVLMLPDVESESQATELVETIMRALEEPFHDGDYEVFVSVSMGLRFGERGEMNARNMLRDADTAMYAAKYGGKRGFRVFDRNMHVQTTERLRLLGDMHRGLSGEQFYLAYQPLVNMADLSLVGVEALARWEHPELGLVMPDTFIPVAENSGLITKLGRQVLEKACTQAVAWNESNRPGIFMGVNVSVHQLRQADLARQVGEIIERTGMNPSMMKLEITESGLMDDVHLSMRILEELKALGVQLQIDDFGTGYSSLAYLQRIPADGLKVDRSFVNGMENDPERRSIVETILSLARSLGMYVVAEGIETLEQLRLLRELGCELGQGYLFAAPQPPENIDPAASYAHLPSEDEA